MEREAKVDPPRSYHCSNQMNGHLSYQVNVRGIALGEDPLRKKKRSQPPQPRIVRRRRLDKQDKENLDKQNVEEPD